MISKDFRIGAGSETLACTIDNPDEAPDVVCLHGGGPSNRFHTAYLAEALARKGMSTLRFDFSGQGESTGSMSESSLRKRFDETAAVLEAGTSRGLTLIGTSMGGYVATRTYAARPDMVANLILFCPAAYTPRAWDLPFGEGFTDAIRRPGSFLESDIGVLLRGFRGGAMLVLGETDDVIPAAVVDMYESALRQCDRFEKLVIPGCPHPIHRWLADKAHLRDEIAQRVAEFVCGTNQSPSG